MSREVQDLTNNYKCSIGAKKLKEQHSAQTEQYLREEEAKDGLYYA